jgi:hypothetical protein
MEQMIERLLAEMKPMKEKINLHQEKMTAKMTIF